MVKNNRMKMYSISILYIFIIGLIFNVISPMKVSAQGLNFSTLDENSTYTQNKYGIKGGIISTKLYKDCKVIVTSLGMYIIKNDKATPYTNFQPCRTAQISRNGNNLFVTPVCTGNNTETGSIVYSTVKIDLNTNTLSFMDQLSKYFDVNASNDGVENAFVDSNNNQWFSALISSNNDSEFYYKLFRTSSDGTANVIKQYGTSKTAHYDQAFSNIQQDSASNVYYTVAQNDDNIANSVFKLERVNIDNSVTSFSFTQEITDYIVTSSGDIWSIVGTKQLVHKDKSGKTISTSPLTNGKSITMDSSNNMYVFDDNTLKKIENNAATAVVTLGGPEAKLNNISLIDQNNYILHNSNSMVITTNANSEYTVVDNYIERNPNVIKDNLGNVFILSDDNGSRSDDLYLKILKINIDGTQEFSKIPKLDGNLFYARAYNGEIYLVADDNTLYKIKGQDAQVYNKFDSNDTMGMMEIDKKGAVYCEDFSKNMIVRINQDKTKIDYDMTNIINENIDYYLNNIFIDKYNNMFLDFHNGSNEMEKIYKADSNNGVLNKLDTSTVDTSGDGFTNVFLDENNELNVISQNDYKLNQDLKFTKNTEFDGDDELNYAQNITKSSNGSLMLTNYIGQFLVKSPGDSKFVVQTGYWETNSEFIQNVVIDNSQRIYLGAQDKIFVFIPYHF